MNLVEEKDLQNPEDILFKVMVLESSLNTEKMEDIMNNGFKTIFWKISEKNITKVTLPNVKIKEEDSQGTDNMFSISISLKGE